MQRYLPVPISLQWPLRTSHLEKVSQELLSQHLGSEFWLFILLAFYPFSLVVRFAVKQNAWALLDDFHTPQCLASV